MEVRKIGRRTPRANPFEASLAHLIGSVGFVPFERDFFAAARSGADCEHVAGFLSEADGKTRLVFAADREGKGFARGAGEIFAARFWSLDPATALIRSRSGEDGLIVRLDSNDLAGCDFRRQCYASNEAWNRGGGRLIERLSLVVRDGARVVTLNFFRSDEQGPFSDVEIDNLADVHDVLAALVVRHGISTMPDRMQAYQAHVGALITARPELPRREAEIGAGIVLGMSSEAMALTFSISENTVRTYRKRIYSRLRISSQNELMRIVLPHLACHVRGAADFEQPFLPNDMNRTLEDERSIS